MFDTLQRTTNKQCMAGSKSMGQCPFQAVEGSDYCARHGASNLIRARANEARFSYRLGKYQERYKEFAESPTIKSLREEIGVARMLLEETFNSLNNAPPEDKLTILTLMPLLNVQLNNIRALVESCDKLETKFGMTMDKTQVLGIGQLIVNIVSQHVSNDSALEEIADQVFEAITGQPMPKDSAQVA